MTDNIKLNNYHFGRHVFDYFPWYTYNKDINIPPTLNNTVRSEFNFALDSSGSMIYVWNNNVVLIDTELFGEGNTLYIENGIASYLGIKETVNDWEDIEKIRLRNVIGTKEQAERYISVIDNYNKYHDIISDMVYTQAGEDVEVMILSSNNLYLIDPEAYLGLIEDDDVYKALSKNHNTSFLHSVYSYYCKNGKLTSRQIEAVKKTIYSDISKLISEKDICFFYLKTNRISNLDRVINYLTEVGLSCKKLNSQLLVYKKN